MARVEQITSQEQWDDDVLARGGHPLQLWGWGEVKAAHGWTPVRVIVRDEGDEVIGAAQVLVKPLPYPLRAFAYIPRGPMADGDQSAAVLEAVALYVRREYHASVLSVEPDSEAFTIPQGWRVSSQSILPARTLILDLAKSDDELRAAMAKKTRQYIRKSASDVTIRQVRTLEQLEECLALYHETARRARFPLHSDQYYRDIFTSLGEHSPIFVAYSDDAPVAFLWLAISADTAFELYGGVNGRGQDVRANYALKWHAITKMKQWGLRRYDFGGLIGDGVTTFKKSWASHETQLAGTFDRPLSPAYHLWSKGVPAVRAVLRRMKR